MAQVKYLIDEPFYDPMNAFEHALNGALSPPTLSAFSIGELPGYQIDFKGSFTVSGGVVTGGTVTDFVIWLGDSKLAVAKGFGVDAGDVFSALQAHDDSIFELLFNAGPLKFVGTPVADTWEGGQFNDNLVGKAGDDRLLGWAGDDTIKGGAGNDYIFGGTGFDKLAGGKGYDAFTFDFLYAPPVDFDNIKDFKVGEDLFRIRDFTNTLQGGTLDPSEFHKGTSASGPDQIVIYDKKSGKVFIDHDGAGGDDQYLMAKVKAGTKLSADDFFVDPVLLFI